MKYLKVFTDFVQDIGDLGDAERGRLFTAMLMYAETGEEPELRGNERFLWNTAKKNIDNQRASYAARCEINARIATNRYESLPKSTKKHESCQDKDKDKEYKEILPIGSTKKAATAFRPPTVDEVKAYCLERKNRVDPVRFVDYYTANGWKVGRNPMKDWRAAVRNWEREDGKMNARQKEEHDKWHPACERDRDSVVNLDDIAATIDDF